MTRSGQVERAASVATPIRVLAFSHTLNNEGAPRSQFELLTGLVDRKLIEVTVLSPETGPVRERYAERGIAVHVIEHPARRRAPSSVEELHVRLRRSIGSLDVRGYDLVYGNTVQCFWAIELARMHGVPAIWNIRESEPPEHFQGRVPPELGRLFPELLAYSQRVVFVSRASRDVWAHLDGAGNFAVIPNALSPVGLAGRAALPGRDEYRARLGLDPGDLMILNVGTICDRKNQKELVAALELMKAATRSRTRLFFVGARPLPYLEEMRAAISSLGPELADRIAIVEETADLTGFWSAADVFCFTSKVESYPRAILEAMAHGLPIVASPVFGIAEQLEADVSALFYELGDPADLARKLDLLVDDKSLRGKLARASRDALDRLPDYEAMLDGYAEIVLDAARAPATRAYPKYPPMHRTLRRIFKAAWPARGAAD